MESAEQLRELVAARTGRIPQALNPIKTGKFNTSYLLDMGEDTWVARVAPPPDSVFCFYEKDMMRQEPGIHRLLLSETDVPVAPVVFIDFTRETVPTDVMVLKRLPGDPLSDRLLSGTQRSQALYELGAHLCAVHNLQTAQYGYLGEHAPLAPESSWKAAFAAMWRALVDDVRSVGEYTEEEAACLLSFLGERSAAFEHNPPASLLHMDVWEQNILINSDGHVTGLLDWDRALYGDPEIEFAVMDYCGMTGESFWKGYGRERPSGPDADTRRTAYLLYEIQKYIVIEKGRNGSVQRARQFKDRVFSVVYDAMTGS